jgi:hypothetical protein
MREAKLKEERLACKQFVDPAMGGTAFGRPAAVDADADGGRASPNTVKGTRLYESGLQSKVNFEAKMEHLRAELARAQEWVCALCSCSNSGLMDTCQNVVKAGNEVRGYY